MEKLNELRFRQRQFDKTTIGCGSPKKHFDAGAGITYFPIGFLK